MWKCRGCSRTFADEWAWYCHVSAEEKATSVSKKRPWSLLCLGPSVAKVSEWEREREQREQQRDRWGDRGGGKGGKNDRNPGSRIPERRGEGNRGTSSANRGTSSASRQNRA